MEKESLETKVSLLKDISSLDTTLLTFDLPNLIEKMRVKHIWKKGEPNSVILLKSPDKQIVLIALYKEIGIKSFQSNDSVTIQIIEGKLKFNTRKERVILEKGHLLTLNENIKYSLTTKEETVFLLTIFGGELHPLEN